MHKIMLAIVAIMAIGTSLMADPFVKSGSITTAADLTVFTNATEISFAKADAFKEVVGISFNNTSTSTGTVVTAMAAAGGWVTIDTSVVPPGTAAYAIPAKSFTEAWSGYVVTGGVQVASTATTTKYRPYNARLLRMILTLNATNAVVASMGYEVQVK